MAPARHITVRHCQATCILHPHCNVLSSRKERTLPLLTGAARHSSISFPFSQSHLRAELLNGRAKEARPMTSLGFSMPARIKSGTPTYAIAIRVAPI